MSSNNVTVVDAIKTLAITSLVPMIDKFPLLKDLLNSSKSDNPADEWDFFITSACAGIILLSSEEYKGEHQAVKERLNELDKNYMNAVNDLSKFMEKSPEELDMRLATLGNWILWNVKKFEPTSEEIQRLSLPIGNYIMKVVHDVRQEKIGQAKD